MSCSERLVKLVEIWQGLENGHLARLAGASLVDQLAKKSMSVSFLSLMTLSSYLSTAARTPLVLYFHVCSTN
jgi:hypothetical protein